MRLRTIYEELFAIKTITTIDRFGVERPMALRIYKDPTMDEVVALDNATKEEGYSNIAGIITLDRDTIYIWDRRLAAHTDVMDLLNISTDAGFYLGIIGNDLSLEFSEFCTDFESNNYDTLFRLVYEKLVEQR